MKIECDKKSKNIFPRRFVNYPLYVSRKDEQLQPKRKKKNVAVYAFSHNFHFFSGSVVTIHWNCLEGLRYEYEFYLFSFVPFFSE